MGNKGRGEKTKMNKGRREGQGERANNNKEFSYVFVWCLFRSLIGPKSGQNPKKKKHPNLQPHKKKQKKNNIAPQWKIRSQVQFPKRNFEIKTKVIMGELL